MKWRVRKPGAKERAKRLWHTWFAWYPVRVPTKGRMSGMKMVWLSKVKRKSKTFYCMYGCDTEREYKDYE